MRNVFFSLMDGMVGNYSELIGAKRSKKAGRTETLRTLLLGIDIDIDIDLSFEFL